METSHGLAWVSHIALHLTGCRATRSHLTALRGRTEFPDGIVFSAGPGYKPDMDDGYNAHHG